MPGRSPAPPEDEGEDGDKSEGEGEGSCEYAVRVLLAADPVSPTSGGDMTLMSPTPRHPHPLRRRGRARGGARRRAGAETRARALRTLVLLVVALLATGPHPEAFTAPVASAAALSGGAESTAEHDALDTALRPPHRQAHRPVAPPRPAAPPQPGWTLPTAPAAAPTGPAPVPSPGLHALRCVVLRC